MNDKAALKETRLHLKLTNLNVAGEELRLNIQRSCLLFLNGMST
jgi:hypothetical protein